MEWMPHPLRILGHPPHPSRSSPGGTGRGGRQRPRGRPAPDRKAGHQDLAPRPGPTICGTGPDAAGPDAAGPDAAAPDAAGPDAAGPDAAAPEAAAPDAGGPDAGGASRSAVAIAAIPSPRPVRPRPSVVVAETLTVAPPRASDRAACASARRPAIRGRLPMIWTAMLPTRNPASSSSCLVRSSRAAPLTPSHCAWSVPKTAPRSPSWPADSSASQIACAATSPSEWPLRPRSPGQCNPARYSSRPSPNGCTSTPMPTCGSRLAIQPEPVR